MSLEKMGKLCCWFDRDGEKCLEDFLSLVCGLKI